VDYVALGPIFRTRFQAEPPIPKVASKPQDLAALVAKPLVAIGGITLENAEAVLAAGADCVAWCIGALAARGE